MENSCNYTDSWLPYIMDYDKFEYDVELHNGDVIENCYPNAGLFNQFDSDVQVEEEQVKFIRFSNNPKTDLNYSVSNICKIIRQSKPILVGKPTNEMLGILKAEYVDIMVIENPNDIEKLIQSTPSFSGYWNGYKSLSPQTMNYDMMLPPGEKRGTLIHSGGGFVRKEAKVGRNEFCSYGSGKKYKKCCEKSL